MTLKRLKYEPRGFHVLDEDSEKFGGRQEKSAPQGAFSCYKLMRRPCEAAGVPRLLADRAFCHGKLLYFFDHGLSCITCFLAKPLCLAACARLAASAGADICRLARDFACAGRRIDACRRLLRCPSKGLQCLFDSGGNYRRGAAFQSARFCAGHGARRRSMAKPSSAVVRFFNACL